ncbi:MAG: SLC13 family permease [Cyclobacteriaceae bacterium]|jgi:di/tricarboxylate transporter
MTEAFQPYFVLIILSLTFATIYLEVLRPSVSFLLAVLIFTITGILDTEHVLAGFSNSSIAVIILLIVITAAIRKNYKIELIFDLVFKKAKTYRNFLIRMMAQVAILSALINNTAVVALMTPYVYNYGRKNNIAPSKLLIPLSYATIMGGMLTLIGTSTTLVLNGFITEAGLHEIRFNDLIFIGSAVTITGIAFIVFFGFKLLPNHTDTLQNFSENKRKYLVETWLDKNSPLINQTVIEAGLRNLQGVYLVEIQRQGQMISPITPHEILQKDDVLFFAGDTSNIMDLINEQKGLILPEKASDYHQDKTEVIEAVVAGFSSIIGKTVKESNFRNRYDAAIIAIHRNGEKISGKIGDIEINPGDVLLLFTGKDFGNRVELYKDIYVINKVREIAEPGRKKYYAIGLILLGSIVLLITKGLALFPSLLIIFTIMVGFGLISVQDIRRELDFNLIGILVFSLAIGQAMILSGAGVMVAEWLIGLLSPFGRTAILIGLILITNLLTSLIGNVGAVSITFPIALGIGQSMGIDATPYFLGIAYAASAAFITPFSYQTNLLVYGPGGYNLKDFVRIGVPVTLIYLTVAFLALLILYNKVFIPM